ncbi:hypothetical protein S245_032033 [Arachis hypogaea]|nr:uncharacterized protein DS421_10g288670 [Arachis hypogaea]
MHVWILRKIPSSDWRSLPFPPFEFVLEVPHHQEDEIPDLKGAFLIEKECKIYLAGVSSESELSSPWEWNKCNKTYEFDVERKEIITETVSTVNPPSAMVDCFKTCINGETYFLKCSGKNSEMGFWVLGSSKSWDTLSLPFNPMDLDIVLETPTFVLGEQICLQVRINNKERFYVFDTKSKIWKEDEEKAIMDSFKHPQAGYCFPSGSVCVEGLSSPNTNVALSWLSLAADEDCSTSRPGDWANITVCALFVSDKGVVFYQPIDKWFGEYQPTFLHGCFSKFIDLGSGMVCALVCGQEFENDAIRVLCMSILSFTMHDDGDLDIHTASPPSPKTFLSVTVLRRGAFKVEDYIHDDNSLLDAFICPLDPIAVRNDMFNSTMKLDLDRIPEEWYKTDI